MTKSAGTTTVSVHDDQVNDPSALSPDQFDELMQGLPEEQKQIRIDRIAGEPSAAPAPPGLRDIPASKKLLVNLRFPNMTIFVPQNVPNGLTDGTPQQVFNPQNTLEFVDSYLLCTDEQAAFVLSVEPFIHVEPTDGEVLTFTPDGFKTRNPAVLAEYASRWAADQG